MWVFIGDFSQIIDLPNNQMVLSIKNNNTNKNGKHNITHLR